MDESIHQKELEAESMGLTFSEYQQHAKSQEMVNNPERKQVENSVINEKKEKIELAKTMMSKKDRRLYERIQYGRQRKQEEVNILFLFFCFCVYDINIFFSNDDIMFYFNLILFFCLLSLETKIIESKERAFKRKKVKITPLMLLPQLRRNFPIIMVFFNLNVLIIIHQQGSHHQ